MWTDGGTHAKCFITTVPPNVNQFSRGWTVLREEAVSGSSLQDGLDASRQYLNGWKRSRQIRYKINETKNMKTRKYGVSRGMDLV